MITRLLKKVAASDRDSAGGKAVSLGELMRAGFSVPPGFVITTEAYDLFMQTGCISDTAVVEVRAAFNRLGSYLVAVRSSATVEDAPDASWAGQLDTFLNTNREHLITNIERCFRSLGNARASAYSHGAEKFVKVAVIVQKMVQSDIAGVAFTVNPVSGARDEIVVEWINGLGDQLVSGMVTPETTTFAKSTIATSSHELRSLAELCVSVESHFGYPCDIEWTQDSDGVFWFLQCRPITTLNTKAHQPLN